MLPAANCARGYVAAGSSPRGVTVDPSGTFAYVANGGSSNVSAYAINANTGALTEITGSPFAADLSASSITVDPAGRFAYVANAGSDNVSAYTIDAGSGVPTQITGSPFAAGTEPRSLTVMGTLE